MSWATFFESSPVGLNEQRVGMRDGPPYLVGHLTQRLPFVTLSEAKGLTPNSAETCLSQARFFVAALLRMTPQWQTAWQLTH